jgi:hypothetical protein
MRLVHKFIAMTDTNALEDHLRDLEKPFYREMDTLRVEIKSQIRLLRRDLILAHQQSREEYIQTLEGDFKTMLFAFSIGFVAIITVTFMYVMFFLR